MRFISLTFDLVYTDEELLNIVESAETVRIRREA